MGDVINKVFDIATGKRARWFWAVIIILLILTLVLYPYIDANFLVSNRINQRVELLERISKLDTELINDIPELQEEYKSILEELKNSREKSVANISNIPTTSSSRDYWIKFFGGGALFFFIAFPVLFQKKSSEKEQEQAQSKGKAIFNRIGGFILCIGIGVFLGWLATKIPTIGNVWINAILFPIVLLIIIFLFLYGANSKKHK